MNIRRCSVTSQNMSEITEVLDALDAVFRDTDVPLAKPQEVETVINLIDAGKYQPPATAASPSNAKRGRRSSSPPEGRTEGASDEAEEGQTPGPGGELPHVPPPPPPFPSSWPLPVTHPATPLARATKTSHGHLKSQVRVCPLFSCPRACARMSPWRSGDDRWSLSRVPQMRSEWSIPWERTEVASLWRCRVFQYFCCYVGDQRSSPATPTASTRSFSARAVAGACGLSVDDSDSR